MEHLSTTSQAASRPVSLYGEESLGLSLTSVLFELKSFHVVDTGFREIKRMTRYLLTGKRVPTKRRRSKSPVPGGLAAKKKVQKAYSVPDARFGFPHAAALQAPGSAPVTPIGETSSFCASSNKNRRCEGATK